MWPVWVSNQGPLAYESDVPLTVLRGQAINSVHVYFNKRNVLESKYSDQNRVKVLNTVEL